VPSSPQVALDGIVGNEDDGKADDDGGSRSRPGVLKGGPLVAAGILALLETAWHHSHVRESLPNLISSQQLMAALQFRFLSPLAFGGSLGLLGKDDATVQLEDRLRRAPPHPGNIDPRIIAKLDQDIDAIFNKCCPQERFYTDRMELQSRLSRLVERIPRPRGSQAGKTWSLHPFGSSVNKFALEGTSDLDLCLKPPGGCDVVDTEDTVERLVDLLEREGMVGITDRRTARIPIVMFTDPDTNIHCDVCINNQLALQNTHLLRVYGSADDRFRKASPGDCRSREIR